MESKKSYLRISKYNPIYRDTDGGYTREEWTDFSDIGKSFSGEKFTKQEYEEVEQSYVLMIYNCFKQLDGNDIFVSDIEIYSPPIEDDLLGIYNLLKIGQYHFTITDLPILIKLVLRNHIFGKMVSQKIECHFGYDFYTYIVVYEEFVKNIYETNKYNLYIEKVNPCDD